MSGGSEAAMAKRTARLSCREIRRCRQARRPAAMTSNVHGNKYMGSSIRYLPGEFRCPDAYCKSGGASTDAKRPTRLFQKNVFKCCGPSSPRYTNQTQGRMIAA